ncbi:hypothetical protein AURDEDRAFT_114229 [Auricularia subglabra TFB-10046 SS5]|nr:hypothetical protein AURDEDRAFT_114229 [Auricularia subglabra TFB-10046 SS5]
MYELLRLYRDRDARDAKIRSLEQALAEARRATPATSGSGADPTNKSAQVQQLEEALKAHQRQLEELKTANVAHTATIATMKASLDEKYAAIDELRKGKEAQETVAEQLQLRNALYQQELDQLRAQNAELEENARTQVSQLEEQLKVASANSNEHAVREELLRMTQEHVALQEKLQQMEQQLSAGASSSEQVLTLTTELEGLRQTSARMEQALAFKSKALDQKTAEVDEKNAALRQMQTGLDALSKRAETLGAQLGEANGKIQQLRGDAHQRAAELEKTAGRCTVLQANADGLKRQLDLAHNGLGEARRAAQQAIEEGEAAKKERAAAEARIAALESDLKDTRSKANAGAQRITVLMNEVKQLTANALEFERERVRLSNVLEAKTAEVVSLSKNSDGATSELTAQIQKLTSALAERANELGMLQRVIAERDGALANRTEEFNQKSQELAAVSIALRDLRMHYDALQAKLAQVVPKDQHDAQISHMESQLNTVRAKLAEAEARVGELDAQVLVLKNPHLGTPTPGARIDSPVAPTPEPNASIEEFQLVKDLRKRVRDLENEKAQLRRTSSGRELNAIGECKMHSTIADVLSTAKDKHDAGRIWVTNMYTADEASSIPQSDVFLAYHHDLHSHPRLTAVDFFKVCEGVIPGVHIEKGAGSTYYVKGMSKRRVPARDLLSPRGSIVSTAPAFSPVSATTPAPAAEEKPKIAVSPDEKKTVKVLSDQGVQYDIMDNPAVATSSCHARQKPWVGDLNLDFKLWLRHRVLGLSDMACMHPVARTSAQALRRYLFAKSAIEKVRSLGWDTDVPDVFRVPADNREYRNATFNLDSVRESVGVSSKLWEADVETFARGVEGCELVLAWLRTPEDPVLKAKFGNMTRHEFDRYKRVGDKKKKRPREDDSDASAKKARVENGSSGTPGRKTPIVIDSSPPPPLSSQT